jgi:predicted transposase/invertase (TIGR01784 family)
MRVNLNYIKRNWWKKYEEIKDSFKAKGLEKAKEVLDYLKCSDAEKREYEYFKESLHYQASMYESTYVVGKMDGIKEGVEKGKLETAKAMLSEGLDIKLIVKMTGLTEEMILQ